MSSFHVRSGSAELSESPRSLSDGSPLTFRLSILAPSGTHSLAPRKPVSAYGLHSTRPLGSLPFPWFSAVVALSPTVTPRAKRSIYRLLSWPEKKARPSAGFLFPHR